jgi:hypothetical protein
VSNLLAIATVTAALCEALQNAVNDAGQGGVPGARVTHLRPGSDQGDPNAPGINVFLYLTTVNPALANDDLPTRRADGSFVRRPRAALDLFYLMTFYGDDGKLEPQRLFGIALSLLHAEPVLSRALIRAVVDATPYLGGSDLAEQRDLVRVTPAVPSVDELSRLWLMFPQVEYELSAIYQAGPVLVDWSVVPHMPLPARGVKIVVQAGRQPEIERLGAADGGTGWPGVGQELVIMGRGLAAPGVEVRIGGNGVAPTAATDREIRVVLDPPTMPWLRAGPSWVQVVHPGLAPDGRTIATAFSNIVHLTLLPGKADFTVVATPPDGWQVTATLQIIVGARQAAELLLNPLGGGLGASFPAQPRQADGDELVFTVTGLETGTYLARARIDAAESLLDIDQASTSPTYGRYVGPTLVLP